MDQNRRIIPYNPKEIIEYLEEHGVITPKDLNRVWGYDRSAASAIFGDLQDLKAVFPEKIDEGFYITNYRLTETGRTIKDSLQPRTIILVYFPVISKIAKEQFNYFNEILQIKGISFDELQEMIESESPELMKLIEETRLTILKELSPDELRQLAREVGQNKNKKP